MGKSLIPVNDTKIPNRGSNNLHGLGMLQCSPYADPNFDKTVNLEIVINSR